MPTFPYKTTLADRTGDFWAFEDGTILPVVAGGADDGGSGGGGGGAPAPAPAAAAPTAEEEAKHQSWLETLDPQTAGEIRRLRDESAGYRTKLREYEAPFSAYSDEQKGVWFRLATTFADDPEAGAKAMKEIADGVLTPQEAIDQHEGGTPAAVEPQYVTKAELAQVQKQAEIDREVEKMQAEAAAVDARYSPNSDDYFLLLRVAQRHGGDLKAAHAELEAAHQATIDAYVKGLQENANGHVRSVDGGGAPANDKPILSFEDAKASLQGRLRQAL